ncbi:hypothetical protein BDQ17DRAFT_1359229 [Cyathus striatus]|nr:hypothetical protein BDQ17DRAFT_1359229 [Cyathus striatus]
MIQQVPVRSLDIWFDDGNVILEAGGIRFKVYKGTLAANSTVFRDMFEISHPDKNLVEGCPVVQLYDSPKDLAFFLKAIHFLGHCKPTCTREGFPQLVALLRLGTKYQILYPASFEKWLERDKFAMNSSKDSFVERAMWVVQLARETQVTSLLPSALYVCTNMPDINYILDGIFTADGEHIELGWLDKRACIRGREKLSRIVRNELFKFATPLADPNPECRTPELCALGRMKLAKGMETLYSRAVEASWALRLKCPVSWKTYGKDVCDSCMQQAQTQYNSERARIWDLLPEIFDLPSWQELRKQDGVDGTTEENELM